MLTKRPFPAICAGLLAWCAGVAGVPAQEAADAPAEAEPSGIPALIDFPWHLINIQITERRYRIEALRFKARDETGVDWPGSDEVMVEVVDSEGTTVSEEIGGIDSGDTHDFLPVARSCIVAVVPGEVVLEKSSYCDIDDVGNPAPLSFHVEMWEKDPIGWPSGFCAVAGGDPADPKGHWGPWCVDDGDGDDFIGHLQVDFTAQELEAALPSVGDQIVETVVLHPCEGDTICAGDFFIWDLPDYSFTYRVTRVPDKAGIDFRAELAEAMRRSGEDSELEAILAGLRALRAPEPRRIVTEEGGAPAAAD